MNTAPTTLSYEHIEIDYDGAPFIAGTTMKVVELVMAQMAYGWSPEELLFQHPYLSLGQIYAALAYYWDHKAAMDADIARRSQLVEALRRTAAPSRFTRTVHKSTDRP